MCVLWRRGTYKQFRAGAGGEASQGHVGVVSCCREQLSGYLQVCRAVSQLRVVASSPHVSGGMSKVPARSSDVVQLLEVDAA